MTETVFLNGNFMPLSEAKISVLDRGWMFGDGVYEVIPVYNGHPFRLEEHLQRLKDNLHAIQITSPYSDKEWVNRIKILIRKNMARDASSVYLQMTRGVAKRVHAFPEKSTPSLFMMVQPIDQHGMSELRKGVAAITHKDVRWEYCNIKSTSLLANVLLKEKAKRKGVEEALLIRNDLVMEGASSNFFIIKAGKLLTPPKSQYLLPGITRDLILELAEKYQLESTEKDISLSELMAADEVWISSSTKEILPVIEVDGKPIGDGKPGSGWRRMSKCYQHFKDSFTGE